MPEPSRGELDFGETSASSDFGELSRVVEPSRCLVIMPARDEAANIGDVISELREVGESEGLQLDILVIDDASRDETAAVARRQGADVVSLPCNLGYGGAVQAGFRYAVERGYAFGLMMDADGQHDPQSIPALLDVVRSGQADVALGSRFLGDMKYDSGLARQLGMRLFSGLVSRFTGQRITDATSGFQAMTAEVMRFFCRDNYPSDFPDADTIILLLFTGFRVREVPVTVRERISGRSMHAGWKPIYYIFKMMLSIFIVMLRQKTHRNAVRSLPGRRSESKKSHRSGRDAKRTLD